MVPARVGILHNGLQRHRMSWTDRLEEALHLAGRTQIDRVPVVETVSALGGIRGQECVNSTARAKTEERNGKRSVLEPRQQDEPRGHGPQPAAPGRVHNGCSTPGHAEHKGVKKREDAGGRKMTWLELDLGKARHPLQDRGLDSTTGHGVDRPAAALRLESGKRIDQWIWGCARRMRRAYDGEPNGGGWRSEQRHQGQSGRRTAETEPKFRTRFDNTREEEYTRGGRVYACFGARGRMCTRPWRKKTYRRGASRWWLFEL
jgi:hypothetical protein